MSVGPIKLSNFAFLEYQWPDLACLAGFAESYVYADPASSLVKLRIFAEKMVDVLYYEMDLIKPYDTLNFRDLLHSSDFKKAIPNQIINFLDFIRKEGNKSAHENTTNGKPEDVIRILANVQHPHTPATEPQKEAVKAEATQAAETVGLTEAQTRKQLIDSLLMDAFKTYATPGRCYNNPRPRVRGIVGMKHGFFVGEALVASLAPRTTNERVINERATTRVAPTNDVVSRVVAYTKLEILPG